MTLIAFGNVRATTGSELPESGLARIELDDDGGMTVEYSHSTELELDVKIKFPPNTVEAAIRKKIRPRF